MADLDHLWDAMGEICSYIELRIRQLFDRTTNEFDFPPWIQATMLFYEFILPCDYTPTRELVELAEKLVEESEKHENKAYFYQEKDGKKKLCYVEDVSKKVKKIKAWIEQGKKYVENFDQYIINMKYFPNFNRFNMRNFNQTRHRNPIFH